MNPDPVLAAVARACSDLVDRCPTALFRAEPDGPPVLVAAWGDPPTDVDGLAVQVPVRHHDDLWGWLGAGSGDGVLPIDARDRLNAVAMIVTTAIDAAAAGAAHQAHLAQLAEEQRSLRAVAELVVRGRPPLDVFTAVAVEASGLLHGVAVTLTRYDGDRYQVVEASPNGPAQQGDRIWIEPGTLPDRVRTTARPSRVDDYRCELDADLAVRYGLRAAVAVPIVVAGQVWGQLTATSTEQALPSGVEDRLLQFAGLVAGALTNVQARGEAQALAAEHAALRRVAEHVARDDPADEILDAVAREAADLAGVHFATVLRYLADGATEIIVLDGGPPSLAVGMRAPATGDGAVQQVWRSGRAARADDLRRVPGHWPSVAAGSGFSSSAAAPIRIDAALWGVLVVVSRDQPLPPGIEEHLSNFSELAGTAIAAVQARRELEALAKDQAALRRVAELVAHGVPLEDVFTAVATEASTPLADRGATLTRYLDQDTSVVVASHASPVRVGLQVSTKVDTAIGTILRTGRAVRLDTYEETDMAETARRLGIAATVTVPVVVEGRIWGTLGEASSGPPLRAETEERLTHFADLAASAIANAENRAKLTASRARVVAAADETRRRVQRDVHDTAQQRLVHAIIALQLARDALAGGQDVAPLIAEALRNAQQANRDIRDIVRGILPAALTRGGLAGGLETLVYDLPLPVRLDVHVPRLPAAVETTAYFVVAEALTNVVKHAGAQHADVRAGVTADGRLYVEICDDGGGGADAARGSGLTGLLDRVEAGDGTMTVTSAPGAGTTVRVELPVDQPGPAET